jgi:hypothetical protein
MMNECSNECAIPGSTERPAVSVFASKNPFEPDIKDGIFAIAVFILGFIFARWVVFHWQGWSVTIFTLGYLVAITIYFQKKGVIIPSEGWFWLVVTALTGISYSLWNNHGLEPWRSLFLFFCGVYWVIYATGLPLMGKTSNYIGLDVLNGLLIIPFKNFDTHVRSFAFLGRKKQATVSQFFSVALGIAFAIIIGVMVFPLLIEADSGGFAKITNSGLQYIQGMKNQFSELIFHIIISIPTAAYIFGLVAGSVYKRGCFIFKKEDLDKGVSTLRLLPAATVYTLLGLVCSIYAIFVVSQLPYFFSAFIGERPDGWLIYSEYARKGFFELCTITAINLSLLTATNLFSKKQSGVSPVLKFFNVLLALLTLLLISTAISKLALYIGAYGLSVRRLLPSVFLIFLAIICGGIIVMQKRQFSILRLAAITGAVILSLLCLFNPDGLVSRYNAKRYLSGTLNSFDVEILYQGGPAGVEPALQVYTQSNDPGLREQLKVYLDIQQHRSARHAATPWDSIENLRARQKTADFF